MKTQIVYPKNHTPYNMFVLAYLISCISNSLRAGQQIKTGKKGQEPVSSTRS
jgi:hypothetical protein